MSKTRDLFNGKINPEEILGTLEPVDRQREFVRSLGDLSEPALKGGDLAIAMMLRIVNPNSQYATSRTDIHRPVLLPHPLPVRVGENVDHIGDEERSARILTFSGVAKAVLRGHDNTAGLKLPYSEIIRPVALSTDGARMIVGQRVYSPYIDESESFGNLPIIEGTYSEFTNLQKNYQGYIPEQPTFITILAHAEARGVNDKLFKLAMLNQFNQEHARLEAADSYDGSPLIPPIE